MKKILSQFVLVASTGAMLGLFLLTLGSPDQETYLAASAVFIILVSVAMERLFPFQDKWNESQDDALGDITLFVLIFGVLDSALKWLTPFALLALFGNWSSGLINLPLWQQIILAGMLIELGAYISHYLHHNTKFLWPLHAMHHSPKRLYTLNNFRFHPLNHIINHIVMIAPVLLIGFSAEAILAYSAISMPVLLLQHSNIDFKFGWMNSILNTNEVHRWHHSNRELEGNANYGRATLIWDRLFGTYYFSREKNTPETLGLFSTTKHFPNVRNTLAQILYPFSRQCCSTHKS